MKVQKIKTRSSLFSFTVPAGWDYNLHLIRGERFDYLVDTGLGAGSVEHVREYLNADKPLFVINTHHHWDHVWGNAALERAVIVAHASCPALIRSKWDETMQKYGNLVNGNAVMRFPDLLFERGLYFPGDGIRLFHTPGHTEDSVSVLDEKDGVLNAGDNIGDTMEELVPSLACDKNMYRATLESYRSLDFDAVVSGHNIVLGRDVVDRILQQL